jgi:hypothetical protein
MGDPRAVQTLNRLMELVCLRRTKEVLLTLPKKYKRTIVVTLGEPWEEHYRRFHNEFIQSFG